MKKRILKKSEVLKEGYIKGLKKAQRIIESAIAGQEDTEEHLLWGDDWETLDSIEEDLRASAESDPDRYGWAFDMDGEIDEDALSEAARQDADSQYDTTVAELKGSYRGEVVVMGSLGLWDGKPKVERGFDNIKAAIGHCLQDYNRIYVRGGDLCVDATHHDGKNSFILRGVDKKAMAELEKVIDARYDEENGDWWYGKFYDVGHLLAVREEGGITEAEFESCIIPLGAIIQKHYGW